MRLTVNHKPMSKARHRHAKGVAYDPQCKDKRGLKWHFAAQMRDKGILKLDDGPIAGYMRVCMPKPQSWSQKRLKSTEGQPVITKPDVDNLEKFYLDVLNGIAYSDDRLISSLWCEKVYSDTPGVLIELEPIGGDMINEHAKTVKDNVTMEDLSYMIKKANRLGRMDREITRVYAEEDDEGKHIYFEVESPKVKEGDGYEIPC